MVTWLKNCKQEERLRHMSDNHAPFLMIVDARLMLERSLKLLSFTLTGGVRQPEAVNSGLCLIAACLKMIMMSGIMCHSVMHAAACQELLYRLAQSFAGRHKRCMHGTVRRHGVVEIAVGVKHS